MAETLDPQCPVCKQRSLVPHRDCSHPECNWLVCELCQSYGVPDGRFWDAPKKRLWDGS